MQNESLTLGRNLTPFFLGFAGLTAAVFVGFFIGVGDWLTIYLPTLCLLGGICLLWLGSRYWLLIPFSLSFSAPVIPIMGRALELPELTIAVCSTVFLARLCLRAESLNLTRRDHLPFLLYAGWALFIFAHNPTGFTAFGAASGGARFYLKILLGLCAFLIIANQRITNRDCKWILISIIIGTILDFGKTLIFYFVFGSAAYGVDVLDSYTWQQELSSVPLVTILILFSRYRASQIFLSSAWKPLLLLVCVPIILLSGKRAAAACLVLYPGVAALARKEFRYLFAWVAAAVIAAIILVGGHGSLFHLPLTAQRALSWLPGQWDSQLSYLEGGKDEFRSRLRKHALDKIHQEPWIGTGYDIEARSSRRLSMTMANKSDAYIAQMALGSSWHNRWLGYAADFGIPATIFLGIIFLFVIVRSWRLFPRLPARSLLQTMVLYILIMTITDVAFSHVSGHSATDAFTRWWMYGLLVSVAASLKKQERAAVPASEPVIEPTIPRLQPVHSGR